MIDPADLDWIFRTKKLDISKEAGPQVKAENEA
jgi:hypothetical protein